jgi:hypothetical protein
MSFNEKLDSFASWLHISVFPQRNNSIQADANDKGSNPTRTFTGTQVQCHRH